MNEPCGQWPSKFAILCIVGMVGMQVLWSCGRIGWQVRAGVCRGVSWQICSKVGWRVYEDIDRWICRLVGRRVRGWIDRQVKREIGRWMCSGVSLRSVGDVCAGCRACRMAWLRLLPNGGLQRVRFGKYMSGKRRTSFWACFLLRAVDRGMSSSVTDHRGTYTVV